MAVTVTSEMKVLEEEFERECAVKRESIRRKLEEESEQDAEQKFKGLTHVLDRSKFYSAFLNERLEDRKKELKEDCLSPESVSITESNKGKKMNDKLEASTSKLQPNISGAQKESDTKDLIVTGKRKRKQNPKYAKEDIIDAKIIKEVNAQKWPEEKLEVKPLSEPKEEKMRKTACGIMVSKRQPYFLEGTALRPYQLDSLDWLRALYENGMNGILADEMGLGKTIQTIGFFCLLVENGCPGPFLVVAPLSTLPNWSFELKEFSPKLPSVLFHGLKVNRDKLIPLLTRKHRVEDKYVCPVVLTSYEIAAKEKFLKEISWNYLVVDEGHRLKNYNCILGRVLKEFTTDNRLLLTGTPIQNDLSELWAMLNFIMPSVFDDLAAFESWFTVSDLTQSEGNEKILKQEEKKNILTIIHQILKPFLLRRVKADVELDIPPKKEVLVYTPMTAIQLELYQAIEACNYTKLLQYDKEECAIIPDEPDGSRPKRKCSLTPKSYEESDYESDEHSDLNNTADSRPKRRCSHTPKPYEESGLNDRDDGSRPKRRCTLTPKGYEHSALNDTVESISEKSFEKSKEDIAEADKNYRIILKMQNPMMQLRKIVNHPYLVHYPVLPGTEKLKVDEDIVNKSGKLLLLDAMLPKLKERGHKVLLFSTFTVLLDLIEEYLLMRKYEYARLDGSVLLEDRQKSIEKFNTDPNMFIFIISTRAGGLGINLKAADTVIIYDSDWNPQVDLQAQDRCHRIGQTKPVIVYRFITPGTVDDEIAKRAGAKRKLEKIVIQEGKFKLSKTHKELVNLNDLKQILVSPVRQRVIKSSGYVFSNADLDALLDRNALMSSSAENASKGKDTDRMFEVVET